MCGDLPMNMNDITKLRPPTIVKKNPVFNYNERSIQISVRLDKMVGFQIVLDEQAHYYLEVYYEHNTMRRRVGSIPADYIYDKLSEAHKEYHESV